MASQSERPLGAFCFLYLTEFKRVWNPPTALVQFRNKVIHRGYLPREVEVLEYCESVYNLIQKVEKHLNELSSIAVEAESERELQAQENSILEGTKWLRLYARVVYVVPGTNPVSRIRGRPCSGVA